MEQITVAFNAQRSGDFAAGTLIVEVPGEENAVLDFRYRRQQETVSLEVSRNGTALFRFVEEHYSAVRDGDASREALLQILLPAMDTAFAELTDLPLDSAQLPPGGMLPESRVSLQREFSVLPARAEGIRSVLAPAQAAD